MEKNNKHVVVAIDNFITAMVNLPEPRCKNSITNSNDA